MQVPRLSDETMPPEKSPSGVEIIKANVMTPDDSVNLDFRSVGYVAYICKDTGSDTQAFKKYNELCQ